MVDSADESFGYAVAASDGVARCVIPNETVIPARGHYLCINSVGYSLGVAAGAGNTALGDATYTTDIPAYLLKFTAGADAYNDAVRLQIR